MKNRSYSRLKTVENRTFLHSSIFKEGCKVYFDVFLVIFCVYMMGEVVAIFRGRGGPIFCFQCHNYSQKIKGYI